MTFAACCLIIAPFFVQPNQFSGPVHQCKTQSLDVGMAEPQEPFALGDLLFTPLARRLSVRI
jgi:hypothetical protein